MHAVIVYGKFAPFHVTRLEAAGVVGREQGHNLIGIEIADSQNDYHWPDYQKPGQNFSYVPIFRDCDYWTLSYRCIKRVLCLKLDELRPDVLVLPGWGFKDALAGLGWGLRRKVPRVVISDNHVRDPISLSARTWIKRLLVKQFQAGLAAGTPQIRYLADLGLPIKQCFVGADVVDNDWFARESGRLRELQPTQTSRAILLSCLRLISLKNIPFVLDVLAHHAKEWDWIIAGYGPQRQEIEQQVGMLGLQERVRILGHIDYWQLPKLYAEADVYLQPSLSERWGLAVNEAMACGLPVVVSTHCGCHEDLVQEGVNGSTFDPTDTKSLVMALGKLGGSRAGWKQMGQASRKIVAQWGPDLYAQNLWHACDIAVRSASHCPTTDPISQALGFVL